VATGPVPSPLAGEVLIQVAYVGVGATDIAQRTGKFMPKEDAPFNHKIIGLEVSGVVVALGEGAQGFSPGDRVCALVYGGGYAEYATAPTQTVLKLPDSLTLAEGAAVPENYFTVWRNVFSSRFGNLLENPQEKTFLVHGGAGGIGSIAILLAHQFGAKVITTVSSPAKAEAVTKWGADLAINYKEEPFPEAVMKYTENKGADLILCFIGGDYVAKNIDALANFGKIVQIGLRAGKDVAFDLKKLMHKWGVLTGGHLRPTPLDQKREVRDALAEHVVPLWEKGLCKPLIYKELPFAEAAESHRILERSEVFGKVVLKTSAGLE